MTRVAFVCHWDWVLRRFRLPVARALLERGVEVVAVCPDGPDVDALRAAGLGWRAWEVDRTGRRVTTEAAAVARLAATLRRLDPDAVHLFTIRPILDGAVAARLAGVPTVVAAFSGLGWTFSDDGDATATRRLAVPALRRALGGATVTAMNPEELAILRDLRVAHPDRSRLVPEGVDLAAFPASAAREPGGPLRVLMAARLLDAKGPGDLVTAADLLAARGVDVEVVIAGTPDLGNPDAVTGVDLHAWSRRPNVVLPGPVEDVAGLLAQADVAVLPTRYPEGAPRFLMEAAACARPAVAADLPGCHMVVADGETGHLVPPGDPGALADALGSLARDPEGRARMGRAARRHAEHHLGDQRVTDAHVALYRDLGVLPGSVQTE